MRWSTSVDLSRADAEEGWRATQGRSSGVGWEWKGNGMLDKHTSDNQRGYRADMMDGEEGTGVFVSVTVTFLRSEFRFLPRRFNKL